MEAPSVEPFAAYEYQSAELDDKLAEQALAVIEDGEAHQLKDFGGDIWVARVGHTILASSPAGESGKPVLRGYIRPTKERAEMRFSEVAALLSVGGL